MVSQEAPRSRASATDTTAPRISSDRVGWGGSGAGRRLGRGMGDARSSEGRSSSLPCLMAFRSGVVDPVIGRSSFAHEPAETSGGSASMRTHSMGPASKLEPDLPIRTERLSLRAFQESDLEALASYRSRPDVTRYLYWVPESEEQVRTTLARKIAATAIREEGD